MLRTSELNCVPLSPKNWRFITVFFITYSSISLRLIACETVPVPRTEQIGYRTYLLYTVPFFMNIYLPLDYINQHLSRISLFHQSRRWHTFSAPRRRVADLESLLGGPHKNVVDLHVGRRREDVHHSISHVLGLEIYRSSESTRIKVVIRDMFWASRIRHYLCGSGSIHQQAKNKNNPDFY